MSNYLEPNLLDALQHDEELVAVIRGHLYVEAQLNRLLDTMLPYPDELSSRLGWPQRVDLAMALGLKGQYRAPLKRLGTIRNRFAHQPNSELRESDISALYDSLSSEDKQIVLTAFERTQGQVSGSFEGTFSELRAKDRFTLIVVTLHAMLLAAVSEVTSPAEGT